MAMLDQPDLIARLVERDADSYLAINEALFSRCADCLDVYYFGSDFGTQQSLFVSRALIQQFYLPHVKRLAEHAKGYGLKVMYHTCGAVRELIPDLIACGSGRARPGAGGGRGDAAGGTGAIQGADRLPRRDQHADAPSPRDTGGGAQRRCSGRSPR